MAKQEVGLKIDVDVSSVGNMKQQLRAATNELVAMNDKFGSSSKEAIAAAQKVAKLKDAIGDAKALADTFNPDKKFVALGGAVQGAVAGFSALQGAMGLFGSESKDVEKLLLKVQSAMALQQGISGVAGAMDSMKLLAGTIKTQVVTAFSTLRGAIIATGLGALAVGIGLVIANFDKFKAAVFNLIPGLKGIADFVGNLITKFTDFVGITSEAERNLEKFTKASKRSREEIGAQIKLLEAQGGQEAKVYSLKKQNIESELNDLREAGKVKGKLTEEEQKQIRDLKNEQQLLDLEEVNRKKKLAEDETKRVQEENDKAKQKRDQEAQKRKQEAEQEAQKLAKIKEDAEKVLDDARRVKLTEQQREEEDAIRAFNERKKSLELAGITDFASIIDQRELELSAIRKKYKDEEEARLAKEKEDKLKKEEEENQRLAAARQNTLDQQKAANEALIQAEIELQNRRFDAATAGLALLESLAGENEKIANVIFAVQKGLEIARIITDTARGIVAAKAGLAAVPPVIGVVPNPAFVIAAAAAAKQIIGLKIAAGASIASIAAASISKFKGGGGGGAIAGGGGGAEISTSAPLAPQLAPEVTATQVNTAAVNEMGNRATRAYVLNSDIQNEQQRNAYIDRNASIGNP
jgi:hypothetical protein